MIIKDIAEWEVNDSELAQHTITNLHFEIDRLNKIIKEAKECINYYAIEDEDYSKIYNTKEKAILEILDKGSDNNE